jgi:ubiquinone/menaquinone biosynthesis C-methylase UbiE
VPKVSVGEHFGRVAAVYESLRTTDEAPVRRICQLLPGRPVTGLDIGCGTGRYTRLLRALLPEGSRLAASDVSAAMLAQLQAASNGHARGVAPLLAAAEQLPLRDASLDAVTAFNCIHHFDLGRFLTSVARALKPGGQLFIYTRTPQQNARTIWGRYFPGFTEHEQRLHTRAAFRDAVGRTGGLTVAAIQAFQHPRSSTADRLQAQAEGCHYSTFSLYTPEELRAAIAAFLAHLPSPEVRWVDEHLLVVVGRSRRNQVAPGGRAAGRAGRSRIRPSRSAPGAPVRLPRGVVAAGADHPVAWPVDDWRRPSEERPDRRIS